MPSLGSSSSGGPRIGADGKATTPTSAQANAKKLMTVKRPKPKIPFFIRPRYRFELPDPPMDMKMLLGQLSSEPFCEPFVSDLEKEFRPVAIPSDPSHAIRANLSIPAVARSKNLPAHKLTIDDDALLQSVVNARMAGSKLSSNTNSDMNPSSRSGASTGSALLSGTSIASSSALGMGAGGAAGMALGGMNHANGMQMQASSVSNAPWMRRMSYDEYAASGTANQKRFSDAAILKPKPFINKAGRNPAHVSALRERRQKQLLTSFTLVKQPPVHPDIRKGHLKPTSVVPVFPDFSTLGSQFVLADFDEDEHLTLESRMRDGSKADEAIQSLASVSVTDSSVLNRDEQSKKKYIACYTPTDSTLEKRARKRDDALHQLEQDEEIEAAQLEHTKKKIHYVEDEVYEWMSEYVIRESRYVENSKLSESGNRSCFAVTHYESENGSQKVACFTRVGTKWKLSRKPVDEITGRLGKEGLKLMRNLGSTADEDDNLKRDILSGNHPGLADKSAKKKEELVDMLEEE